MRPYPALVVLAALLWVTACASFTSRPSRPDYAGPGRALPVRLNVTERGMQEQGDGRWADRPGNGELAHSATQAIVASGWIDEHRYDESSPLLDVRISNYQSDGPNFASVITACLVPGMLDNRITIDAELAPPRGEVLKCSREIDVRTWFQTFLIVLYPVFSPRAARAESTDALALQCVAELLKQSASTAAP